MPTLEFTYTAGNDSKLRSSHPTGTYGITSPNRQFPNGYFKSAVMPLKLVRPRPNPEIVGKISYDHNGYIGIESVICITLQGGAYPYFLENIQFPSGATVGATYADNDYMVVKYTPTQNGIVRFKCDVVDMDGARVAVSWSMDVNPNWLAFLSNSGNDTTGTGAEGAPWQTITKAFATLTGGKMLCFENGTYVAGGSVSFLANGVNGMFARNSRGATIDGNTQSGARYFYMNASNAFIGGLRFINPSVNGNPRWFSAENGPINNVFMDNCYFDIGFRNPDGAIGDNRSCFFLGNTGPKFNIAQTRNYFTGFTDTANGWSAMDIYSTNTMVFERNRFGTQSVGNVAAGVIWVKGDNNTNITIRGNVWETVWSGIILDIYLAIDDTVTPRRATGNVEVCYNYVQGGSMVVLRSSQSGQRQPVWSYRNVFIGGVSVSRRDGSPLAFYSDADIIVSDTTTTEPWKIHGVNTTLGNPITPLADNASLTFQITNYDLHRSVAQSPVDINGHLTGADRTANLGQKGYEIAKP